MDLDKMMRGLGPMQEAMRKADAERGAAVFEGKAGGGAVTVRLKGALTVERLTIAPAAAAAAGGDVGMLEDLVAAAVNDVLRQYRARYGGSAQEQMQKLMAGQDLTGLIGGLFGGQG